jgi:hypothetical protein
MEKSANKRWKESGTSLSFKDWIERENQKKQSVETNYMSFDAQQTVKDTLTTANTPYQYNPTGNNTSDVKPSRGTVLGLDKRILLFSTLLIVGSIGYLVYGRLKEKK